MNSMKIVAMICIQIFSISILSGCDSSAKFLSEVAAKFEEASPKKIVIYENSEVTLNGEAAFISGYEDCTESGYVELIQNYSGWPSLYNCVLIDESTDTVDVVLQTKIKLYVESVSVIRDGKNIRLVLKDGREILSGESNPQYSSKKL